MKINNFLCIIYKFVKIIYKKIAYEDTIFASENLRINMKVYLFAWAIFYKLKNKLIQTGPIQLSD
jgi:hypothetical protein